MNYHNRIMNIKPNKKGYDIENEREAWMEYKIGHRDARHEAAEIALEAEGVIEDLLEALEDLSPHRTGYGPSMDWNVYNEAQRNARAAITKARGEK